MGSGIAEVLRSKKQNPPQAAATPVATQAPPTAAPSGLAEALRAVMNKQATSATPAMSQQDAMQAVMGAPATPVAPAAPGVSLQDALRMTLGRAATPGTTAPPGAPGVIEAAPGRIGPLAEEIKRQRGIASSKQQQLQGEMASAFEGMAKSEKKAGDVQRETMAFELEQLQKARAAEQAQQAENQARENERQKRLTDMVTNIEDGMRDIRNTTVEPMQVFQEGNTAQNIGMAFALALGGFGAALTGGRDIVKDQIDRAVENDLVAQREALNRKKEGVEGAINTLDIMRGRFADERQAEAAAKLALYDGVEKDLIEKRLTFGAQGVNPELDKTMAHIKLKKAETVKSMIDSQTQEDLKSMGLELQAQQLAGEEEKLTKEAAVPRIEGLEPTGETDIVKTDVKEVKKLKSGFDAFMSVVDKAIAFRKKYGVEKIPSEARATASTLQGEMMNKYRVMEQFGAPQPAELKLIEATIGVLGDIGFQLSKLETLKNVGTTAFTKKINPYGYRPSQQTLEEQLGFKPL